MSHYCITINLVKEFVYNFFDHIQTIAFSVDVFNLNVIPFFSFTMHDWPCHSTAAAFIMWELHHRISVKNQSACKCTEQKICTDTSKTAWEHSSTPRKTNDVRVAFTLWRETAEGCLTVLQERSFQDALSCSDNVCEWRIFTKFILISLLELLSDRHSAIQSS